VGRVDFVAGLLHVRRNFTGGADKMPTVKRIPSVPMMPAVIDTPARLKDRQEFTADDDLVFTREGEHLDPFALRRRYYAAVKRARLRRLRFLIYAMRSVRPRSPNSIPTRSSPTWGTSTTPPPSAICTTNLGARTPPDWPMLSGINWAPTTAQLRTRQRKTA